MTVASPSSASSSIFAVTSLIAVLSADWLLSATLGAALLRLARTAGCCSSSVLTILPRLTCSLYRALRLVASVSRPSSTASLTSVYASRSLSSEEPGEMCSLPRSVAMSFFSSSIRAAAC